VLLHARSGGVRVLPHQRRDHTLPARVRLLLARVY
jgi:hypothetical protein